MRALKARPVAAIALRQYYLMRGNPTRILPMVAWVAIDMVLWGLACWLFSRVHRNAVRSGLLARYSAESAV